MLYIRDVTQLSHNGCRLLRRGRLSIVLRQLYGSICRKAGACLKSLILLAFFLVRRYSPSSVESLHLELSSKKIIHSGSSTNDVVYTFLCSNR